MAKTQIKLRRDGLIGLRCSNEVSSYCLALMMQRAAAAGAGDGYEVNVKTGGGAQARAHIIMKPTTAKARQDNLQNNTLAKVVG